MVILRQVVECDDLPADDACNSRVVIALRDCRRPASFLAGEVFSVRAAALVYEIVLRPVMVGYDSQSSCGLLSLGEFSLQGDQLLNPLVGDLNELVCHFRSFFL